jgi:hypothetical protein
VTRLKAKSRSSPDGGRHGPISFDEKLENELTVSPCLSAFALRIQPEVINPALDAIQRNGLDLSQQVGALIRLRIGVATERECPEDDEQKQLSHKYSWRN